MRMSSCDANHRCELDLSGHVFTVIGVNGETTRNVASIFQKCMLTAAAADAQRGMPLCATTGEGAVTPLPRSSSFLQCAITAS